MESEIVLIEVCEEFFFFFFFFFCCLTDTVSHRLSFCCNIIFYDNHYPAGNYFRVHFSPSPRLLELGDLFILLTVLGHQPILHCPLYPWIFTSRKMAEDYFSITRKICFLRSPGYGQIREPNSVENRAETTAWLLETKIYTIKRNTVSGLFPGSLL